MIIKTILEKKRFFKGSANTIAKLQLKKIRRIFEHAKQMPYYKDLFSRLNIHKINDISDFEKIPFLDKKTLREQHSYIVNEKIPHSKVKTSGSSGEPVIIYKSKNSIIRTLISGHPFFISRYTGLKINKVCLLLIWGNESVEDVFVENIEKYMKVPRVKMSVLQPLEDIIRNLQSQRPELIITYPSFLINLREYMSNNSIQLDFIKLIVVSGELISPTFLKKHTEFFQCLILNSYISTEGGLMAMQFMGDKEGMYLISDNNYIEVYKDGRPVIDEEGDIVITELNNYATPLIKYSGLNDRGIISIGEDGKRYLKMISGRMIMDIINKNGKRLCAYSITEIIEAFPEVLKFKILQKTPEHIKIHIITSGKANLFYGDGSNFTRIKKEFEKLLEHSIQLDIEITDNIPWDRNIPYKVVEREF